MNSKVILVVFLIDFIFGCWRQEITLNELNDVGTFKSFKEWQNEYNITYESIEFEGKKYYIWLNNLKKIANINSKELGYKLRMNQFGDMTDDEFKYAIHGNTGSCFKRNELFDYKNLKRNNNNNILNKHNKYNNGLNSSASVDWRRQGVVTPVKNQGQCGSCWAFSATGSMECDYAIKNGELISLSEQELVDCCSIGGSKGCNGGQMTSAFEYALQKNGLCSESEYPYIGVNGICNAEKNCINRYNSPVNSTEYKDGYMAITIDNEVAMLNAVNVGCVSVGIEADQTSFQYYSSGVLVGTCGVHIDHGVLIVGYGTQSGQDYWLVKNSWGKSWGEQGYIKICRNCNKNNGAGECGILRDGNIPIY